MGNAICLPNQILICQLSSSAGILEQSIGARNRGGIGLSYRPARLHRLAEFRFSWFLKTSTAQEIYVNHELVAVTINKHGIKISETLFFLLKMLV